MPIVQFSIMEGRTVEQKRLLARRVSEAVCDVLHVKPESVRILINELTPDHFSIGGITATEGSLLKGKAGESTATLAKESL